MNKPKENNKNNNNNSKSGSLLVSAFPCSAHAWAAPEPSRNTKQEQQFTNTQCFIYILDLYSVSRGFIKCGRGRLSSCTANTCSNIMQKFKRSNKQCHDSGSTVRKTQNALILPLVCSIFKWKRQRKQDRTFKTLRWISKITFTSGWKHYFCISSQHYHSGLQLKSKIHNASQPHHSINIWRSENIGNLNVIVQPVFQSWFSKCEAGLTWGESEHIRGGVRREESMKNINL